MTKINEFLYASEATKNQRGSPSLTVISDSRPHGTKDPQLQQEVRKVRALKMLQDIPGIG
jgi:hypothetical protein